MKERPPRLFEYLCFIDCLRRLCHRELLKYGCISCSFQFHGSIRSPGFRKTPTMATKTNPEKQNGHAKQLPQALT